MKFDEDEIFRAYRTGLLVGMKAVEDTLIEGNHNLTLDHENILKAATVKAQEYLDILKNHAVEQKKDT